MKMRSAKDRFAEFQRLAQARGLPGTRDLFGINVSRPRDATSSRAALSNELRVP